jgi:transketolase C-terminal domain/subunit
MEWAMNKMYDLEGPSYLRFSKVGTAEFHNKKITEKKLKMFDIKPDGDIAIFATGGILEIASEVVSRLRDYKINASLISVPVISPLDKKFLLKKIINKKAIFTVEEHYRLGGLSSAIKDALNDEGKLMKVHTFGIDDKFTNVTGSIPYLLSISGLSPIKITKQIVKSIA